ncbi:hypothetical protein [Actinomadura sp. NTSP31]|uniref:hypothetical protein n=1 Tax=Actinomadura sp. NTSP31 TaxID=1735447 RepID=UPI0035C17D19
MAGQSTNGPDRCTWSYPFRGGEAGAGFKPAQAKSTDLQPAVDLEAFPALTCMDAASCTPALLGDSAHIPHLASLAVTGILHPHQFDHDQGHRFLRSY